MKDVRLVLIIALTMFINGCGSYFHFAKDQQIKKEAYPFPTDSIVLNKAIICGTTQLGMTGLTEKTIDKDSVFTYFLRAIEKVNLPIKVEYPDSLPCKARQRRDRMNFDPLSEDELFANLDTSSGQTSLQVLPVIGLYISDVQAYYAVRVPYITLQLYIVQHNKLVYSSFLTLQGESINTLPANPPLSTITQEQWDELVRLVFEDYLIALDTQYQN